MSLVDSGAFLFLARNPTLPHLFGYGVGKSVTKHLKKKPAPTQSQKDIVGASSIRLDAENRTV
ncbi:MAG: hypothetical protein D3913_16405 [Candidatus Electrothrix sp. LOE1_4_5]|nr:hypothetical protein [Candidatus Electrothrix gigas]